MIASLALLTLGVAFAQDAAQDSSFDIELFRPQGDFYGYGSTLGAATLGNLQLGVGASLNYSNDPLVLVGADGARQNASGAAPEERGDGLIDNRLVTDFQVGMGFTRYASLTADIPLILVQDGFDPGSLDDPTADLSPLSGGGIGDIVLQPKVVVLDRDKMPVGLAVAVPVGLPTGTLAFAGEKGVSVAPTLAFEYSDAPIHNRAYKIRAAVNAGYKLRSPARLRDVSVGNALLYAAAVGYHPIAPLELNLEFHGAAMGGRSAQNAAEVLLGVRALLGRALSVSVGGGTAVLGGIGAPDYRIYAGVQVAPSFDPENRDTDGDNIVDGDDKCPKDTEDADKFQDKDGCPELDNDADGREDTVDKCPNDPEDDDGYMDNDGCPESDNDKDGVVDASDQCPDQPETVNSFRDEDGCPDEAPSVDSDGDGFEDDIDRCPYDAEDLNQFEDEDGCPDDRLKNARVVVTQGAIKINDVIFFNTAKATIQERSFDLLNELAAVIVEHPEIKKLRVEGHTDNTGDDAGNFRLSQARAEAVMAYLKAHGVEGSRLDAAGFGEMRPIATNDNEDGRSQNRRVEFIIVDRD